MLDDSRDSDIRPDAETGGGTPRSPWEPPRDSTGEDTHQEPQAPKSAGGGPQPEEDIFTRLNVVPGEETAATEPPFVVTERDLGVNEEPKGPSKAATFVAFGVVVMAVLGILMTVASVKLFLERAEMSQALDQSVNRLAMVYAGPEATDTSRRRIAWLRKSIEDGDFGQAQKAIESLGTPPIDSSAPPAMPGARPGDGAAGGADSPAEGDGRSLPRPAEDTNLPVAAQAFFEQHPKLWEAFFGFTVAIKQMERREMAVGDLARLRSEMITAAEFGQTKKVEDLLDQARERIEQQSSNRLPQKLQAKLQEFGEAMQEAQNERRDVRAAVQLARESERAAKQGDIERAAELMDKAIAALRNAPRMALRPSGPRAGARGRMPQMGPEIGLIKYVADLAAKVMRTEERDLTQIWESVNIAAGAIREKNAEQIREILDDAKDALHNIGDRRREMSAAIAAAQERVREARSGEGERPGERGPSEEQQRQRRQMILGRVAGILAKVRAMPEEEFEANRAEIAQAVIQAMNAPLQTPPGDEREDLTPEERVRRKMEIAGDIYLQLKERGTDTSELDEKFSKVRELLTEHEYEKAEKLVDEGMEMMREIAQDLGPAETGQPDDDEGYGRQLQFDAPAPSLDLGATTGEPDIPGAPTADDVPPAPDAADVPDAANEGVEQ